MALGRLRRALAGLAELAPIRSTHRGRPESRRARWAGDGTLPEGDHGPRWPALSARLAGPRLDRGPPAGGWHDTCAPLWSGGAMPSNDFGETVTILVVEDDGAGRAATSPAQPGGRLGATVDARREVFHHVRVEVLVVDVNLPGISGLSC